VSIQAGSTSTARCSAASRSLAAHVLWRASPLQALSCGLGGCHPTGQRFRNNITVHKAGSTCSANYTVGLTALVDWALQVSPTGCTDSRCAAIDIGSTHQNGDSVTSAVYPVSWTCS